MVFSISSDGVEAILDNKDIKIVFDATSAKGHLYNAPLLKEAERLQLTLLQLL